jgi:hypothetical protein
MESFQESIDEYRKQLEKGAIVKAYRGLMEYVMQLRTYFQRKYPDYYVSGSIYYGYMDMTYFSFSPKPIRDRNLKIAIVLIHDMCRFEAWLAGANKQVQQKYWKVFSESNWKNYPVVRTIEGADSIVESVLVEKPDFNDLDRLTEQIESALLTFIDDIENFLSEN